MSLKSLEQRRLGSFPSFPDGNVVLRLSGEHIYQLHASSLRSQSPVFANLLCSTHGNSQITTTQHDDNESPICYQLELKGAQSGVGRFVVKVSHIFHINSFTDEQSRIVLIKVLE